MLFQAGKAARVGHGALRGPVCEALHCQTSLSVGFAAKLGGKFVMVTAQQMPEFVRVLW